MQVGRSLDLFAKKLNTENNNSKPGSHKLKVFRKEDGSSLPMETIMGDLMCKSELFDGESLILEFLTPDTVSESSETLLNLDKYNK